ncbi:MOSC domain-containing protein [Leifsonia sp. AG29]|uniref:MOSC domain-containing protein n=1 Tax=Leifsonia sp. AG29 TaxID=2598860 RepID=UPI00131DC130|nr:MOSC N-terminal beta barrel domain-containing protein [Leifsonia sp. AG29]
MSATVTALRRYPVKSMGGEGLTSAQLDARGFAGDRWFAVEDADGRFASGKSTRRFRRRDAVFGYDAATAPDGRVEVRALDGTHFTVGDAALDRHLSKAMRAPVRVTPEADVPHQDMGAVSLIGTATLAWCAARWGGSADPRRLRPNIVIDTDDPFIEETWVGAELEIGSARLHIVERVPRCRMIDVDQDGARPGTKWLRALTRERGMALAVYADVRRAGAITLGDRVEARPASLGPEPRMEAP